MIFAHILSIFLFIYTGLAVLYLLFFSITGRFGRLTRYHAHPARAKIAVIIPSYKDDLVIVETVRQAVKQNYPQESFSIIVVADGLKEDTLDELRKFSVTLIRASFDVSMKAKSINAAFNGLPENCFDIAMILDSDNIMGEGCLDKVNHAYQDGWKVIQCHRVAKNKNTPVAILDALSEEINNTIFRRGHRAVGLSCTLIGSGMAFQYGLLKDIFSLASIQNNPGEDREIDIQLIKEGVIVEYIDDAFVYDEKVQRKEVFEKQRTRWIGTQVEQIKRFFRRDMFPYAGSVTYLNKCFQNFLLPRLLFLLLFVVTIIFCVLDRKFRLNLLVPGWQWWIMLFILYLTAMFLAAPSGFYNRHTVKSFLSIPGLIFSMLKAFLKIGQNKKGFLHTPKEFEKQI